MEGLELADFLLVVSVFLIEEFVILFCLGDFGR
jgi:hypothetical protein